MGVITKYKFNHTLYQNYLPIFNSDYNNYTVSDEVDDVNGVTIRTVESDSLPTLIRFGATSITDRERCLLEVLECNTSQVTTMYEMFRGCTNLTELNIDLITDNVTTMFAMFHSCSSLTTVNALNWNTSEVISLSYMFQNCSKLTTANISNFNTEKVSGMQYVFDSCSSLATLNVSNWNTSSVTTMICMFNNCKSLTSLDVSNFNTEKVVNMSSMFTNCSSLTSLDVSNFNTSQVTNMSLMFQSCSSLTSLDVSNFNTSQVTNMNAMFNSCSSLTSLVVSNFNTEKVTNMSLMFQSCSSLTSLDVSNWSTNSLTNVGQMFFGCSNLKLLDISNFNINDNVNVSSAFVSCSNVSNIGMIYCNSSTINKIVNLLTTNTTIWYQDASLSDLTQLDNITYKKYQTTTLSLNEPIQLRSIGDIHDEINYETGEYIQRIGEIIYDDSTPTYNSQIGGYLDSMTVKGNIALEVADGRGAISDKLINQNFTNYDFGMYGNLNGNLYIFDKTVKSEEEFINKYRGTKFQFILLEPIITKIDTTILDQNDSYKSSQQTYDEQTYISVQSDTVVTPSSSVDYEIYSSTGTITGTSATIENAEAGTPVSGVVYGETLLNCVQESTQEEIVLMESYSGESFTVPNTTEVAISNLTIQGKTENGKSVVNPTIILSNSDYVFGKGGRL